MTSHAAPLDEGAVKNLQGTTLDDFMLALRRDVDRFEKHWREQHKKKPTHYPMNFLDDDAGMWWEQFMAFMSMDQ